MVARIEKIINKTLDPLMKMINRSHNASDVYSVSDAAKYMGLSRTMIYYWLKKEAFKIRIHEITGKRYILRWDLDKWKKKLEKKKALVLTIQSLNSH